MVIHQGDSYRVYLDYYVNGDPIEKDAYDDIEFSIKYLDKNGVSNLIHFYLSDGGIVWDEVEEKYYFRLSQEQSFLFDQSISYQLRIYTAGDVYADDCSCDSIGKTLSRMVLGESNG